MIKENEVAVIKQAAEAYMYKGYSPVVLLLESAKWLWDCYEKTKDPHCMEAARHTVQAYVELGLPHENAREMCSRIWELLTTSRHELIPAAFYPNCRLKANRSLIRQVLGPWPKRKNMEWTADDVVKDIIRRIEEKTVGVQNYQAQKDESGFQLVVTEEGEAFLLNIQMKLIYAFEGKR